ncbi:MAG: UDP-N-acetylglucosamine 2-epimerase (non-hydrolyzing) [Castellaniella sp.]|uniref:non-hydrolyzing UDP-N-acetylglucosamine 2-epimerase n=1 Tax=Castellaniella sp. TaxID=1955812 RepID=UPI003C731BBB
MNIKQRITVCLVAGARPNFMKIAPIIRALEEASDFFNYYLIHTGQHYDQEMSEVFFKQLDIPNPDYHLNAGGGTHAEQTAKVMVAFEPVVAKIRPDLVLVVGDVNSTLACSLVAKKLGIRVAHVEAGLRSGDWRMPEEINRLATDAISDLYFVTEPSGRDNLILEGKSDTAIHFVGHVMIDNLFFELAKLSEGATVSKSVEAIKAACRNYAIVTLHRPANVDNLDTLDRVLSGLSRAAQRLPMIFPVHPRTAKQIESLGLVLPKSIHLLPPLPYRDLLFLTKDATVVLTDSGGLQEESTALGIPCLTIRENTERPVTVLEGSNILVGSDPEKIDREVAAILENGGKRGKQPALWDGHAAERIVTVLRRELT